MVTGFCRLPYSVSVVQYYAIEKCQMYRCWHCFWEFGLRSKYSFCYQILSLHFYLVVYLSFFHWNKIIYIFTPFHAVNIMNSQLFMMYWKAVTVVLTTMDATRIVRLKYSIMIPLHWSGLDFNNNYLLVSLVPGLVQIRF